MALTKVLTGGIALDAVDNTILKLDDDYALTGAVSGAGKILQVVQVTFTTLVEITASSYTHYSAADAAITCSSTSSKVLVMLEATAAPWQNNSQDAQQKIRIYKGSSALSREYTTRLYDYGGNGIQAQVGASINHLDSPSSTSELTYKLYFKLVAADRAAIADGSFTLIEIAG